MESYFMPGGQAKLLWWADICREIQLRLPGPRSLSTYRLCTSNGFFTAAIGTLTCGYSLANRVC